MIFKRDRLLTIFTVLLLIFSFSLTCFATQQTLEEELTDKGLMCISYRGDTSVYPENSLEGILSAKEKGADMVSVGVDKTADGIFVLTENKLLSLTTNAPYDSVSEITYEELQSYYLYDNLTSLTSYRMVSLSQAIDTVGKDLILILDIDWDDRDGIYELISYHNAFGRVFIRTNESARKISKWLDSKEEKVNVIGAYKGNIIFSAISHFNTLSEKGMKLVEYRTKNYFGVVFGSFFCKRFSDENAPAVIASMYDPGMSGQRTDSEEGWNELIELGYSAIETNNIVSLVSYIDRAEKMEIALATLTQKAKSVDPSGSSSVLREKRDDAIKNAEAILSKKVAGLDEIESAYSSLLFAMNSLNISAAEDYQKGQLNITAGKVIAALLVGAAIVAAQIYVHKMQEEKRRK